IRSGPRLGVESRRQRGWRSGVPVEEPFVMCYQHQRPHQLFAIGLVGALSGLIGSTMYTRFPLEFVPPCCSPFTPNNCADGDMPQSANDWYRYSTRTNSPATAFNAFLRLAQSKCESRRWF